MPHVNANGIEIFYDSFGDDAAPPILLIMGLGQQMTSWSEEFCQMLVAGGFRAIRFDNRDIGLSTKTEPRSKTALRMALAKTLFRRPVKAGYSLHDMAADAVGLLDALGLAKAHVVGVSMGGQIGQLLAAKHPHRVASFTCIMSTTGSRKLPLPKPKAARVLVQRPKEPATPESIANHMVWVFKNIGSPGFPMPEDLVRQRALRNFNRSYYPFGSTAHLMAVLATGDISALTRGIAVPTLVIHGKQDPLVPVEAGQQIAALVPGARLKIVEGMGHDLSPALLPMLSSEILEHARKAQARAA